MVVAVIFAGGVGSRMHSKDLPKQFLCIHGKPIIVHTVEHFENHSMVDAIVIACVAEWVDYCTDLMKTWGMTKVKQVVPGGETGQLSIYNGLNAAKDLADPEKTIVLIHDGVRPMINEQVITNCIESVKEYGTAITCVPAIETVVEASSDNITQRVHDRESLRIARAPQCFWLDDILQMHKRAMAVGRVGYTDSATLFIAYGIELHLVDGPMENIKVTTPGDFFSLQAILNAREIEQVYISS